jgi:hypothetical protein
VGKERDGSQSPKNKIIRKITVPLPFIKAIAGRLKKTA